MATYLISSPLEVVYATSKKKGDLVFRLNLNVYRNTHRFTLHKAKLAYAQIMSSQVNSLPRLNQIEIKYVIFTGSNRKVDIMNICSIVDKFFCDVLTEHFKIVDDNYKYVPKCSFEFGGIDRNNPRVDIHIKEII